LLVGGHGETRVAELRYTPRPGRIISRCGHGKAARNHNKDPA